MKQNIGPSSLPVFYLKPVSSHPKITPKPSKVACCLLGEHEFFKGGFWMSKDVYSFNMLTIFNCTQNVVCSSLFGKYVMFTYFPFEQWSKPLWTFRVCNKNYPVSHGNFRIQLLIHQDSVRFHVTGLVGFDHCSFEGEHLPEVNTTAGIVGDVWVNRVPRNLSRCSVWVFWEQVGWVVYFFSHGKWKMAGFLWKASLLLGRSIFDFHD